MRKLKTETDGISCYFRIKMLYNFQRDAQMKIKMIFNDRLYLIFTILLYKIEYLRYTENFLQNCIFIV